MNKNPEILMTDVPVTSPYYDRIHALKMERDFASPASPERQWIESQIVELTGRVQRCMKADQAIVMPYSTSVLRA